MSESRDNNRAVSLGCGTLIIIALIVLFVGRPNLDPLQGEIAALRGDVTELNRRVGLLTDEIIRLRGETPGGE